MKKFLSICLMLFILFPLLGDEKTAFDLLKAIDVNLRFYDLDFSVKYTIVSEKPGKDNEITGGVYFRRDKELKVTIIITKPETDKGTGYLWSGDNFWAYDPRSREFVHSSQKNNFKNTDLKNSDFRQYLLTEDYKITAVKEESVGEIPAFVVDLEGTNDDVTYPILKIWVAKDKPVILRREDYGLSGRLMRTVFYPKWTKIEGHLFPTKQLFIDEIVKGEKTHK